jgi:GntR family transcriptional regulator/MocR family aminotransferase
MPMACKVDVADHAVRQGGVSDALPPVPDGHHAGPDRRLAAIARAQQEQAWIIEDDYDSEFHYAGKPTACVQGLDQHERTIYVGTFTKSMFPGLRIGYMVLPTSLVAMTVARPCSMDTAHRLRKLTLARFIEGGHLGAHVRTMRAVYAERRDVLARLVREHLGDFLEPRVPAGGMQMPCTLIRDISSAPRWIALAEQASTCSG